MSKETEGAGAATEGTATETGGSTGGDAGAGGTGGAAGAGAATATDATAAAAAAAATGTGDSGAATGESGTDAATKAAADAAAAAADGKGADAGKAAEEHWSKPFLAGLDEKTAAKAAEKAQRLGSPANVMKTVLAADSKIQELTESMKGMVKVPGADAKPEEIAAFRAATGVPEKVDGYKPYRPEGVTLSPVEEQLEGLLLKNAHAANMNQGQVDASLQTWYAAQAELKAMNNKLAMEIEAKAETDMRAMYGSEYKGNIELMKRLAGEELGPGFADIMTLRTQDGRPLVAHTQLVDFLVRAAKDKYGGEPILLGNTSQVVDVDSRITELTSLLQTGKQSDREKYGSAEVQAELDKLYEAQNRRQQRSA